MLKSGSGGTNEFYADQVSMWILQGLMKSVINGLKRTFMDNKDMVIEASEGCVD